MWKRHLGIGTDDNEGPFLQPHVEYLENPYLSLIANERDTFGDIWEWVNERFKDPFWIMFLRRETMQTIADSCASALNKFKKIKHNQK